MRIAGVQMEVGTDPAENTRRIIATIKESDADVLCFPETCINPEVERPVPLKAHLRAISAAAAKRGVHVIVGSYERSDGKIFNRCWVYGRDGALIHRYTKRHPFSHERGVTAGRTNKVFTLDGVRCGLIICWDYAFVDDIRKLARDGALVIFAPSYLVSFPTTAQTLEKIAQVRAFDAMACYVMVDAYARDSFKQTRICTPYREEARLIGKRGVAVADVDLEELKKTRRDSRNLFPETAGPPTLPPPYRP